MSITFSPLTPSIISRCSMNTASFLTRAPTPSASSACQALGAIWMPAPISPNCGACSSTTLLKPLRASASAAASPPMPPPATITGALFLEEDGDAIEFTFRIHKIDALARDAKHISMRAEPMLDQRAVDALLLIAKFQHRERRADVELAVCFAEPHHVSHLVYGARNGLARVRPRMSDLPHAQLEQRAI